MLDLYIFSKNRAYQLDLLLESIGKYFQPACQITVQWTADKQYSDSYGVLAARYPRVRFVRETDFKNTFIKELSALKNPEIIFLVDDDLFIAPVTESEFSMLRHTWMTDKRMHSLSLRLNPEVNYCYPARKEMKIPDFEEQNGLYITWDWTKSDPLTCWGYPMALDCHLYRRAEILHIVRFRHFRNCNQLESVMNCHRMADRPMMISYAQTKIYNIQHNFVKGDGLSDPGIDVLENLFKKNIKNAVILPPKITACHGYIKLC